MALKAGYYGVKKNVADELKKLDGAKIIKSVGAGLNLSSQGALSCKSATASQAGIAKSTDYLSSSMQAQLPLSFTEDIETSEINGIEVQFDTTPTNNTGDIAYNLITSKGVYDAIKGTPEIPGTDDLNDYKLEAQSGWYRWGGTAPTNSPESATWGVMRLVYYGGGAKQIVISGYSTVYIRQYASNSWSGWSKFSGTAVTP